MKILKEKKGITLIALVITIIVLLILAAVTLSLVLGENGIITKANQSKEASNLEDAKEKVKLAVADYMSKNEGVFRKDVFLANISQDLRNTMTTYNLDVDSKGNITEKINEASLANKEKFIVDNAERILSETVENYSNSSYEFENNPADWSKYTINTIQDVVFAYNKEWFLRLYWLNQAQKADIAEKSNLDDLCRCTSEIDDYFTLEYFYANLAGAYSAEISYNEMINVLYYKFSSDEMTISETGKNALFNGYEVEDDGSWEVDSDGYITKYKGESTDELIVPSKIGDTVIKGITNLSSEGYGYTLDAEVYTVVVSNGITEIGGEGIAFGTLLYAYLPDNITFINEWVRPWGKSSNIQKAYLVLSSEPNNWPEQWDRAFYSNTPEIIWNYTGN